MSGTKMLSPKEQLALLKKSVPGWNQARLDCEVNDTPTLGGADLSGGDLAEANLKGADLIDANLHRSNLSGANLEQADLSGASLHGADLRGGNLRGANLAETDLKQANLTGTDLRDTSLLVADLTRANLSRADLTGTSLILANLRKAKLNSARFSEATLSSTIFVDVDLGGAIGLDSVLHTGPSSIGIDTLYASGGEIPDIFLRGAGVPENLIELQKSIVAPSAIEFYSVFISYSHRDQSFAQRLHNDLQARGVRCWLDEHDLLPGDELSKAIDRGIRTTEKVLLCCSEDSLTSWWVEGEIKTAFDKEQEARKRREKLLALIPLNLDDHLFEWDGGVLTTQVTSRVAANFVGWELDNSVYEKQFERVVQALKHSPEEGGAGQQELP